MRLSPSVHPLIVQFVEFARVREREREQCLVFSVQCILLISQFLFICLCTDDHSRVLLKSLPGKPRTSDYVNANYIDVSSVQCTNSFNSTYIPVIQMPVFNSFCAIARVQSVHTVNADSVSPRSETFCSTQTVLIFDNVITGIPLPDVITGIPLPNHVRIYES